MQRSTTRYQRQRCTSAPICSCIGCGRTHCRPTYCSGCTYTRPRCTPCTAQMEHWARQGALPVAFVSVCVDEPAEEARRSAEHFRRKLQLTHTLAYARTVPAMGQLGCSGFICLRPDAAILVPATPSFLQYGPQAHRCMPRATAAALDHIGSPLQHFAPPAHAGGSRPGWSKPGVALEGSTQPRPAWPLHPLPPPAQHAAGRHRMPAATAPPPPPPLAAAAIAVWLRRAARAGGRRGAQRTSVHRMMQQPPC